MDVLILKQAILNQKEISSIIIGEMKEVLVSKACTLEKRD